MAERILIVGAGRVGASLGRGWLAKGRDVRFAVPDPKSPKYADFPADRLQAADSRNGADVIVLATPYGAAAAALAALGDLTGAIVIDCTNPAGRGPDGKPIVIPPGSSGAEQIAATIPGIPVYKALNQTGAENISIAASYDPRIMMLVAGDDASHKRLVLDLVADLGFEAVDAGPLRQARLLESLAMLWIGLAMQPGAARDFGFAIIRRP